MRILVIQLRRIGDILLTTPVLSYLKAAVPGATVDFLCDPMGKTILETNPNVDDLIIHDKKHRLREFRMIRARRYDAVLDFLNNPISTYITAFSGARWRVAYRTGPRAVLYNVTPAVPVEPEYVPLRKIRLARAWLNAAGLPSPSPSADASRPKLYLADADRNFARDWMSAERLNRGGYAVLAPAHRHGIRAWRPEGYRAVALDLKRRGFQPYLAWGPGEEGVMAEVRRGHEDDIRLLPPTSLRQMAAIFELAAVVVTNDSGAMHLAVSVGTPTVTIYGPTRPVDWNPSLAGVGPSDRALSASGVSCLGCHLLKCPVGHICMKELSDETVIAACASLLRH
jgi:ADP-heptose:LPS heptosyltransferase